MSDEPYEDVPEPAIDLSVMIMRQEAMIAAIDKLTSAVDTNNEMLARMIGFLHTDPAG